MRNLTREIGTLCRKAVRRRVEGEESPVEITPDIIVEMLGRPKFPEGDAAARTRRPGVAVGLAWTGVGGDLLFVEARRMSGRGALTLTGRLGEVMKESARAALSWLRANASRYDIDPAFHETTDLHIHIPEGAIPKDGPSAGVAMASALLSELAGRAVRGDLAMTGEITLSGDVLRVGGIKEKVLAARRHGIVDIVLPKENESDVNEELSEQVRRAMNVHYVSTIEEVLRIALTPAVAA